MVPRVVRVERSGALDGVRRRGIVTDALEPVREGAYLRLGECPVDDPDWDVGIQEVLAMPYYQDLGGVTGTAPYYDERVTIRYDRIPKGEIEAGEEPLQAALREFGEETGSAVSGELKPLGTVRMRSGKVVHAWAVEGDALMLTMTLAGGETRVERYRAATGASLCPDLR